VAPERVGAESVLFHTEGTTSIVQFETDVLGPLTIIEKDPGRANTAYGMLADMIRALGRI
jgi:homoserine dehydrogenase